MRTFATALCMAAAIGAASAASLRARSLSTDSSWETYKSVVGLSVTDAEDAYRAGIFALNVQFVKEHNERFNAGVETSYMAVNHFTHLSQDEFAARYIGGWRGPSKRVNAVNTDLLIPNDSVPASVDWSQKGAVTPIKNQEQCGSCWAFSTTGSVEGISYIKTGTLTSLSEQQLVDCSGSYGNQGCNGGLMDNAFKYIIANKGICSEAAYPYKAVQGTCAASSCTAAATISGYFDVPKESDTAMMAALVQQPVSIAIEADQMSFQFYSGGVMTATCGDKLDHGVLAVGYGTLSGKDFYKVKNSWGATWGMQGYILLGRGGTSYGKAGQCGMLSVPSYPTKN